MIRKKHNQFFTILIILALFYFTLQPTQGLSSDISKQEFLLQNTNGLVLIDDEHSNDYFPNDMSDIVNDLNNLGYLVLYSSELGGWDVALDYADYFIINAPNDAFTSSELNKISEWFQTNPANLLISARGDFSNPNLGAINELLATISSDIRVNDDNVYTTDPSAPNLWYVDSENIQSVIPELTTNVDILNFFSPASLYSLNDTAVDVLVYGDADEYQTNQNSIPITVEYDLVDDGVGGNAIPLSIHQVINSGDESDRVITIGTTMWSNFDYDNDPQDIVFLHNIMEYFKTEYINIRGSIDAIVPDFSPPTVELYFPRPGSTVKGLIEIEAIIQDKIELTVSEIYIDNVLKSSTNTYLWDTTLENAGDHIITLFGEDKSENRQVNNYTLTVNQDFVPQLNLKPKIMTYNIKESGINAEWIEVMKEEDADIAILVETGSWDDNSNALLKTNLNELNSFFIDEVNYTGITDQDENFLTTGVAIISRFPIVNFVEISDLTLDNGNPYSPTHDFLHATIDVNGENIEVIGAHLKCCSGSEGRREDEQEGIINYMDDLGSVPIIYAGDLNSFYPGEGSGLGNGPVSMLVQPNNEYAPQNHVFTDVYKKLNPNSLGYTYLSQSSRIDFIFVNQYLDTIISSSTVGDTKSAALGSDHRSVDVILDFSNGVPDPSDLTTPFTATTTTTSESTDSKESDSPVSNIFFILFLIPILIRKTRNN